MIQLDFFKTDEELIIEDIQKRVEAIKISSDKVRRGTYARLNEQSKILLDLEERLSLIEKYICKGG
jgi:hypothetical protein